MNRLLKDIQDLSSMLLLSSYRGVNDLLMLAEYRKKELILKDPGEAGRTDCATVIMKTSNKLIKQIR
ncbi:MAG: hypothetical protein ACXVNO_00875 [Bacteroidia bacterium]